MKIGKLVAQSDELLHLDFLRFLASAAIVYLHSQEFFYPENIRAAAVARTLSLGLFVDLFFLISGFVISYVYFDRIRSLGDYGHFMTKRVFRLVPLHWVTLVISIAIWTILLHFGRASNTPNFDPVCIANTAVLLHAVFDCGLTFNGQSWSISAEMCAYAVFPILVILSARSRAAPILVTAACIIGVVMVSGTSPLDIAWHEVNPLARALASFSFGVWLWVFRDRIKTIPAASSLLLISFLALLICMMTDLPALPTMGLVYIVGLLGVAADLQRSAIPIVKRVAPLGQLTYSIYMWHNIFILVIMNALGDKLLHLSGWKAIALGVFTYAVIMVVSYLSLTVIETPARRWLERSFQHRVRAPAE